MCNVLKNKGPRPLQNMMKYKMESKENERCYKLGRRGNDEIVLQPFSKLPLID